MDQITFDYNTVLSDVHVLLPNARHLMTRLNSVGQPVFTSKFEILSATERHDQKESKENRDPEIQVLKQEGGESTVESGLDEDGDFDITRRPRKNTTGDCNRDIICPVILKQSNMSTLLQELDAEDEADDCFDGVIRIEHTMATPLEDVGKQVWRGAFLLADFLLSKPLMFKAATAVELGAGTGLTSIIMATMAKRVYCTDVGEDLLSMCKKNMTLNEHMMERAGGEVRVRQLDWLKSDFCTDSDVEFSWTEEEVADIHDNASFIIAADVCYDDDLTDALFRTIYRLCNNFVHACTVFISLEKRLTFTIRDMDVSCEAYHHFRHCLSQLEDLVDGQCRYTVEQLPCTFPQFLRYERIEQLELWKVIAKRVPADQEKSSQQLTS